MAQSSLVAQIELNQAVHQLREFESFLSFNVAMEISRIPVPSLPEGADN
jgi:hypothetical protein